MTHATPPRRWLMLLGAMAVAVMTCVVVVGLSGAIATASLPGLSAPDARVTWLVPLARLAGDLLAVVAVGCLLVAGVLVPAGRHLTPTGYRALRWAGWAALGWSAAAIVSMTATLADFLGSGLDSISLTSVVAFALDVPQGQAQLAVAVGALVVAVGSGVVLSTGGALGLLAVALIAALPPVLSGHATATTGHQVAVTALSIHVVGVLVWAGGLLALVLIRGLASAQLSAVVARFSRAAPWLLVAVGSSGVMIALTRVLSVEDLFSSNYGRLVLLKGTALVGLGVIGGWHRRRTMPALAAGDPGSFWRLAAAELVLFAAAIGLAVGLSRTPTTESGAVPTSYAHDLLGYPLPDPFTFGALFDVYPDVFFPALAVVAVGLYLVGVHRLTSRGVAWSTGRTVSWCLGWVLVLVVTSSGLARYGPVLASVNMIQHMTLSIAAPIFLALSGPLTLAVRSIRASGSPDVLGPREWLLVLGQSRFVRLVSNPWVALAIYLVSLYGIYFTGLYELSLSSHQTHLVVFTVLILVGSLFFGLVIGIDPKPRPLPYTSRILLLVLLIAVNTVFCLRLMQAQAVLASDWWDSLSRLWGPSALEDQRLGAAIGLGYGDLAAVLLIIVLVIRRARSDQREPDRSEPTVEPAVSQLGR